jgi:hypothetical protein
LQGKVLKTGVLPHPPHPIAFGRCAIDDQKSDILHPESGEI